MVTQGPGRDNDPLSLTLFPLGLSVHFLKLLKDK